MVNRHDQSNVGDEMHVMDTVATISQNFSDHNLRKTNVLPYAMTHSSVTHAHVAI